MLRPLLITLAFATVSACSTAVGTAPTVDVGAHATNEPASQGDPSETTAPRSPSTTTPSSEGDPNGTTEAVSASTTTPSSSTVAPPDSADHTAIPRPGEPIVAVWQEDGPDTQRAQVLLRSLGFWLAETNGEYGQTTTQAVMAFQKYYGLAADGKLGPQTAEVMNTVAERPAGRSTDGTLVEIDKSKQLLFIVRDGVTEWVLNTSTGSEVPYREPDQNTPGEFIEDDSITRPGVFAVNREREEGWWEGDLGEIYRPKYFDGGIALHGSYNIPPYPASHGCVRLSIQAMDWIWAEDIVPKGTTVWVHGEIPPRDS